MWGFTVFHVGGGKGGLDHISWEIKWSFHNSRKLKKNSNSHFTEKRRLKH